MDLLICLVEINKENHRLNKPIYVPKFRLLYKFYFKTVTSTSSSEASEIPDS